MIITTPKEFEHILANLRDVGAGSVFLVGCGSCATVAKTGGEPELLAAAKKLREAGYTVLGHTVGTEITCNVGGTRSTIRKNAEAIHEADAVIVFACGSGVQTVAEFVDVPVFPALDSDFLGAIVRQGEFSERCRMCGDCMLDKTAGICPITQCPKGLLNGPCGGMWDGMCEVIPDHECAHVRIQRRLEKQHRVQPASLPPKNYGVSLKPGHVSIRKARVRKSASDTAKPVEKNADRAQGER